MEDLARRLQGLGPTISNICELSGATGASIGVLHQDQSYITSFGFRDFGSHITSNENAVYHLASLSKSFTAAAISILVDEKRLDWNEPLSKILPGFRHKDPSIQKEATLLDFLCHRTGLASKDALWAQDGSDLLLQKSDLYATLSYLETVHPLRSTWLYNNFGYSLAVEVVEKVSGMTWAAFLSEKIFKPLGLKNTFTELEPPSNNLAKGHVMISSQSEPYQMKSPKVAAGTIMQGANGVKSTVKDLLTYYKAIIDASKCSSDPDSSATPCAPFKDVQTLITGHISLNSDPRYEQSYGARWVIADLPCPLGATGTNGKFMSEMPVVGKGSQKQKIWYHNGSAVGFFSSVHILPEPDTVIVVLVNCLAKNDCADCIGQLLVEAVLNNPEKNDYEQLAIDSANGYVAKWRNVETKFDLDTPRPVNITMNYRRLTDYAGRYYNEAHNWFIEVKTLSIHLQDDSLEFEFQGLGDQAHKLHAHDEINSFCWPLSQSESMLRSRWPDLDPKTYVFHFETDDENSREINRLRWCHDPDVGTGEVFRRDWAPPTTRPNKEGGASVGSQVKKLFGKLKVG